MGGVDKNKMLSEPVWMQRKDLDWTFTVNSVQLGTSNFGGKFDLAMMYNFNDFTFLPFDLASSINTRLGLSRAEGLYHNAAGWSGDCSSIKDESLIFNFDFNNTKLEFRRADFLFRVIENNRTVCWSSIFGIVSSVIKPSFGTLLLKNKYVVFDYEKGFMGIGRTDPNSELRPVYAKYSYDGIVIKNELSRPLFIVLIVLASILLLLLILVILRTIFGGFGRNKSADLRHSRTMSPKKNDFVPIRNRATYDRSNVPSTSPRNSPRRGSGEAYTATPMNSPSRGSNEFESFSTPTRYKPRAQSGGDYSITSAIVGRQDTSPRTAMNLRRYSAEAARSNNPISRETVESSQFEFSKYTNASTQSTDSEVYSQIKRQSPRRTSTDSESFVAVDQPKNSLNSEGFPNRFSRLPTLVVPASPAHSTTSSITTLTKNSPKRSKKKSSK